MGVNDDWTYAHMSKVFAATGRLSYDGWTDSMIIPQVIWGAAVIKLFGFSFLALRLSGMLTAVLLIPVLYHIGRISGLAPRFAAFATLLTVLSPVAFPETVTFMSDVPAMLLFSVSVYSGIRAWKAKTVRACMAWAAAMVVAGIVAAIERQVYWLGPLLFVPLIAYAQRRLRIAWRFGLLWLSTLFIMAGALVWFRSKPYALGSDTLTVWANATLGDMYGREESFLRGVVMTTVLLLFPVLCGYMVPACKSASRNSLFLLAVAAAASWTVAVPLGHALPVMGNIVTEYGSYLPGEVTLGTQAVVLRPLLRQCLTVIVLFSGACSVLALANGRRTRSSLWADPAMPVCGFGLAFGLGWFGILAYRVMEFPVFDRYLISFLPLLAIPLLRYYQTNISGHLSRWCWVVLAVFACYGIAATHDTFAASRTRLAVTSRLEAAGVPRTAISGGYEYDGWTQLEAHGYLNHPDILSPAGAFQQSAWTGPANAFLWYMPLMPSVKARYFITTSPLPGLADGPVSPVSYRTWLPPQTRQIFTATW